MDNLKCNRLNCRKVLSEKAVVVCFWNCFGHFGVLRVCAVTDNLYDKQPEHTQLYSHFITMLQARIYSAVWSLPYCDAWTINRNLFSRVCQWAIQRIKIVSRYWASSCYLRCIANSFMELAILRWLSRVFFNWVSSMYWPSLYDVEMTLLYVLLLLRSWWVLINTFTGMLVESY